MKEELNFKKTEKISDKVYYFEDQNENGFLVLKENSTLIVETSYSNFIKTDDIVIGEDGEDYTKIVVQSNKALTIMLEELENNKESDFWELVMMIDDAFQKKNFDMEKFRGDLAEVIFLWNNGGEKLLKNETADIILDGELIEIKSFSYTSKSINISNQQTKNDILTFAVGIKFDNDGKSIVDLSNEIEGNSDFKKYILEKYGSTSLGKKMKYSFDSSNLFEITEFINNLDLNNFIIEAKVRLII